MPSFEDRLKELSHLGYEDLEEFTIDELAVITKGSRVRVHRAIHRGDLHSIKRTVEIDSEPEWSGIASDEDIDETFTVLKWFIPLESARIWYNNVRRA